VKRNRVQSEVAEYFAEKAKGPGAVLGRALMAEDNYASGRDGRLYVYEGGVYVQASSHVKRRVVRWSGEKWTQRIQNETIAWLLAEAEELDDSLDPDVINVKNGLLRWNGKCWRLTKHDPELRTTTQLPVAFDRDARCPIYESYIASSQPAQAVRQFLDEWLGYNLTSDCGHERALLNIGRGGDGKSVFLFILEHLLGTPNVAGKTLQSVATEENRFAAADLYGKLANIYADLSASELKDTGRFKALVSGDLISGEKKRKDPFEFHNVAKMTFSANEVPSSRDASRAYFDRWSVVWWPNQFRDTADEDTHLKQKVVGSAAEMSGVLNRALKSLTRLRLGGQFTVCTELDMAKRKFRFDSDNVGAYLRDVVTKAEIRRRQQDWYEDYKGWCSTSKHIAVSRNKFYERMRQWRSDYGVTIVATTSHKQKFFTVAKGGGRHGR
jgi:putative DNA primase/helicase